jgi:hypothetical protein
MKPTLPNGFSPGYFVFHTWLKKNRNSIKAGRDRTVIYSGLTSGNKPIWTQLDRFEELLSKFLQRKLRWEPIESVLRRLDCKFGHVEGAEHLPPGMAACGSVWDFACHASDFMTDHERQQVWKNLSAWYVKNAEGEVFLFRGHFLKQYPDFLLAEIPVLARNKNVDEATLKKVFKLLPESEALWKKYRGDDAPGRSAGRG